MKIFVIPSVYPSNVNLNSGVYIHELNKAFYEHGYEVIVLNASAYNYKHWNERTIKNISVKERDNIGVYSFNYRGFKTNLFPKMAFILYYKKLNKLFEKAVAERGVPDLIVAHFTFTSGYGTYLLSKKYNIPFIVIEHHSLFLNKINNNFIKKITKEVLSNSNEFICVSNHLAKSINLLTNNKRVITIIPNLIGNQYSYYKQQKNKRFIFFSAGNLVSNKKFDLLIQSFIRAFDLNQNVSLIIAGEGNEKARLEKIINSRNRNEQIKLIGYADKQTMLKYYKLCNSFVLFSKYETFGIVYREALMVGRPIISSMNGGILEDWNDQFGLLVDNLNIECCSNKLKEMYLNYTYYDGYSISKEMEQRYSKEIIIKKYDKLMKSAIRK